MLFSKNTHCVCRGGVTGYQGRLLRRLVERSVENRNGPKRAAHLFLPRFARGGNCFECRHVYGFPIQQIGLDGSSMDFILDGVS